MPRANRLKGGGGVFHLTHRCYNRAFLGGISRDYGSAARYRVFDVGAVVQAGTVEELRRNLAASLAEWIARAELKRQACWTESLAVGSLEFVKQIRPLIL